MNSSTVTSVWNGIQTILNTKIFNKAGHVKITQEEWASTYTAVRKCCANQANRMELYTRVKAYLTAYLTAKSKMLSSLGKHDLSADEVALIIEAWKKYHDGIKTLDHLLAPLNKTLVASASAIVGKSAGMCKGETIRGIFTIYDLGVFIWTNRFFPRIEPLVYDFIINTINTYFRKLDSPKSGAEVDLMKSRVSGAITLYGFTDDGENKTNIFYKTFYVKKYLADLEEFYLIRAKEALSESKDFLDYIHKINQFETNEIDEVSHNFLKSEWRGDVTKCLYNAFVNDKLGFFIHEFNDALIDSRFDDIATCIRVIADNNVVSRATLDRLYDTYDKYIQEMGLGMIKSLGETADSQLFIDTVLDFYINNEEIIKRSLTLFENKFITVRDRAFKIIVNKNDLCPTGSVKPAEFLSRYIDTIIRVGSSKKNGSKGTPASSSSSSGNDTEHKRLFAAVDFLRYIDDKDAFLGFYKRALSKRLIQKASNSIELERTIEGMMEKICGTSYSMGIKNIINDYEERNKCSAAFRESEEWRKLGSAIVPQITLITGAYWALPHEPSHFRPPPEILAMEEAFGAFYSKDNKFRRITWDYQFAKGELTTNYLPKTYTITCPAYQLGVLTFFNKYAEGGTIEKICDETKITIQILECSLFPLTQLHIINHDEKTGLYTLNKGFVGKKQKIALFLVSPTKKQSGGSGSSNNNSGITETGGNNEGDKTDLEVMLRKQRTISAQAAVVRVMKREKKLLYDELFDAATKELAIHFKLSQQVFEKALDALIDQEFLVYKKDTKTYHYN